MTDSAKRALPLLIEKVEQHERSAVGSILATGRTPPKAIEVAANGSRWVDQLLDDAAKVLAPPACGRGCSWCCHQTVLATVPEVFRIIAHLHRTLSREDFARIQDDIRAADDRTRALSLRERFHPDLPCPLLVDGACSVYEVRPITCRGLTSYSAQACEKALVDPEQRAKVDENGTLPIPACEYRLAITGAVARGQQRGLEDAGLVTRAVELNAGLRMALDAGITATARWLEGEALFEEAELPGKR